MMELTGDYGNNRGFESLHPPQISCQNAAFPQFHPTKIASFRPKFGRELALTFDAERQARQLTALNRNYDQFHKPRA